MAAKTLLNSGVLYTDRREFYIDPKKTSELFKDVTPFLALTEKMSSGGKAPDPNFKMFEHRSAFELQRFYVNEAGGKTWSVDGSAGDTISTMAIDNIVGLSSTVDSSYIGLTVDIFDSTETTFKGKALITAASTTINLKSLGNPNASNNKASAIADNDIIYVYGSAKGEGTVSASAWADELQVVYNSTQIFSTPLEVTGTVYENAKLRGYSDEVARLRLEKQKEHRMKINRTMIFGTRPSGTGSQKADGSSVSGDSHSTEQTDANSNTVRLTMGIYSALQRYGVSDTTSAKQNVFSVNRATYNYDQFVTDMEKAFWYMPGYGRKIAFAGRGFISFWNKVASGGFIGNTTGDVTYYMNERSDALGTNVGLLVTPHGELEIVYDPSLRYAYNNSMVVVDPEHVRKVAYRDSKLKTNIKTDDGYDGYKDEYFDDCGVGIDLIETHSLWTLA